MSEREKSLSNLSAIISTESNTKYKRLHELVKKRIESIKSKNQAANYKPIKLQEKENKKNKK